MNERPHPRPLPKGVGRHGIRRGFLLDFFCRGVCRVSPPLWGGVGGGALLLFPLLLAAQTTTLSGHIFGEKQTPQPGATIALGENFRTVSDDAGNFFLEKIPHGRYALRVYAAGFEIWRDTLALTAAAQNIDIQLVQASTTLTAVDIRSVEDGVLGSRSLRAVEGVAIYEGKKSEVVLLQNTVANLATNNPRQVYARVTGLNIWESDGAGLQLGIGGRGLSPNRTANFNTRQNGYDIAADALGYPESYYTPPVEALDRIELVRGAASLQYGTQFGGMLNFVFRRGPSDRKLEFTTRQTLGSWGYFGSFNSAGGTVGRTNYFAFYQYKRGGNWRPNGDFEMHTGFASAKTALSKRCSLGLEVTKMHYLAQQPGGLTDKLFEESPEVSLRARNWFRVDWNLAAATLDYEMSSRTRFNARVFGLSASRQSLGNLERITVADLGGKRTLIDGQFRNIGSEVRLLHRYPTGNRMATALVGLRFYQGTTTARQGDGSAGGDADFRFLNPQNLENSDYRFPSRNVAAFTEHIFQLTERWSVTPGLRYEFIGTQSLGSYKIRVFDFAGNLVSEQTLRDDRRRQRGFVLGGLGTTYRVGKHLKTYANLSQNYRAINFSDLRIANPNFRVDTAIRDERGFTFDLGVRGNHEGVFFFDATLFYIAYRDRIGQVLRADQPPLYLDYRYRANISDARNVGVEAFAEVNVLRLLRLPAADRHTVAVFANIARIDARYIRTDDPTIRGKRVEMAPPFIGRLGATYRWAGWSASVQYAYTAEHFSDATNAVRTSTAVEGLIPAYAVADFSVQYSWKKLSIELNVNNLLNSVYFTRRAESYPGPGIIPGDRHGVFATVQGRF